MAELFIVATPIGNLEDITFRAVRVLREVDLIACEDTRHTRKLLDHYGITTPCISYYEHNEAIRAEEIASRLVRGQSVAIVSDAGTPLISDPGYRVVTAAIQAGIPVVPVPGPSAAIAALSAAGLPTADFRFCGFVPSKAHQRRRLFEAVQNEPTTLIFYEAPHRILQTAQEMLAVFGPRRAVFSRELTKVHEEFLRGTLDEITSELRARTTMRGEFTILIDRAGEVEPEGTESVIESVARLEKAGLAHMDAIKQAARERGLSKREVYRLIEEEK